MMSPPTVALLLMWVVACSSQYVDECDGDNKLVEPPSGKVCGSKYENPDGSPYWVWRGLPYAQPPVGPLRFMDPIPAEPWEGIRDAANFSAQVCPQLDDYRDTDVIGEEDCLYLDVYSPMGCTCKKLPVMVFLGIGIGFGDGSVYSYFPDRFMTKRVVFVVIQNRLNWLGFLSTGDKVASGNQALKDQEMALRWIQENIVAFGGDKNRVTLFGQNHGAVSTHLQMLNPRARGLFSRAILQSGTALLPFEILDKDLSKEITRKIASRLNCISEDTEDYDSQEVIVCLQNVPVDELLNVDEDYSSLNSSVPILFGPRIDGEVLPDHPAKLLKEGRYSQVDLISGVMKDEGVFYLKALFEGRHILHSMSMDWDRSDPNFAAIKQYYFGDANKILKEEDERAIVDMAGHMQYHIPHDYVMQLHSRDTMYGKQVFAYEFHHRGEESFWGHLQPQLATNMVSHKDDIQYLFIMDDFDDKEDLKMSSIMIDLWYNFAAHGNPTPDHSLGFIWNPVNLEKQPHLVLKLKPHMEDDTRCQERRFWRSLDQPVSRILFPEDVAAGKEFHWQYPDQLYQQSSDAVTADTAPVLDQLYQQSSDAVSADTAPVLISLLTMLLYSSSESYLVML